MLYLNSEKAARIRREAAPKEIREVSREIQAKTKEAEQDALKKGRIDYGRVREVVNLKLLRDEMYVRWGNS